MAQHIAGNGNPAHFDPSSVSSVQEQMQEVDIGRGIPSRKKKSRHVLDSSLNSYNSPGFSNGQFASQGALVRDQALSNEPSSHGQVGGREGVQQVAGASSQHHANSQVAYDPGSRQMEAGQFPSIVDDLDELTQYYRNNIIYTGQTGNLNPPAYVDYTAVDTGASNPKFVRLSMGSVPTTDELLAASQLPMSLIIQPLAELNAAEGPVPLVDCEQSSLPRCHRCRTYMNPHMQFVSGGGKFVCNICEFTNETPPEYYSPADQTGRRQDLEARPELQFGTCDFDVGKDYWSKEKQPGPVHTLFAIDVSEQALVRDIPKTSCDAIREALYGPQSQGLANGARIGIMTFDRACHFYNLGSGESAAPQMLYVTDVEDMFVPLTAGLFVDPEENRASILSTLNTISTVFEKEHVPEPALGAAMRAAYLALSATGGKLCLFLGALPTWGPGRLKMRENSALYNTTDEKKLFEAESVHWKNVSEEFVNIGVGVDCFFFPASYMDIATVGTLSHTTGGDTFFYQNFVPERDAHKFIQDFARSLSRPQGTAVQMKIRCSNGLKIVALLGGFLQKGGSDLEMGSIDSDKAVTCILKHDGKLSPTTQIHFQSAVLYTTPDGRRRLRIHNIKSPVTAAIGEVMRYCDAGAAIVTLAKLATVQVLRDNLKHVKESITDQCVRILASYRKNCAVATAGGELILPESLKLFPLLTLAMQKQFSFRTDSINSDVRINNLRLIRRASARDVLLLIYPRLIPIHTLQPHEGLMDSVGSCVMPMPVRNSFSQIENGGVYLLDNGQSLFLWFKSDVSPLLLQDLYGAEFTSLESLNPRVSELPALETLLNIQVRNIITHLNQFSTSRHLVPQMARQGLDGSEMIFAQGLVDDRNGDNMSYNDFLIQTHKQIQLLLAEKQQSKGIGGWLSGTEHAY